MDRDGCFLPADLYRDDGLAVGHRAHNARGIDDGDPRVAARVGRIPAHIPNATVHVLGQDAQLLPAAGTIEPHLRREHME